VESIVVIAGRQLGQFLLDLQLTLEQHVVVDRERPELFHVEHVVDVPVRLDLEPGLEHEHDERDHEWQLEYDIVDQSDLVHRFDEQPKRHQLDLWHQHEPKLEHVIDHESDIPELAEQLDVDRHHGAD
jgi:hypothetical protein